MTLDEWRHTQNLTYSQLATKIGVTQAGTARRYALGEQWPRPETLDRIVAATNGAVTVDDMHACRVAWLKGQGLYRGSDDGAGS